MSHGSERQAGLWRVLAARPRRGAFREVSEWRKRIAKTVFGNCCLAVGRMNELHKEGAGPRV